MESWKMLKDVERCWKMLKDVERCWKMLKDVLKFGSQSEFHVSSMWVPCEFHVSSLSFRIASYKRPQPGAAGCRVPGAAGDVVPAASVLGRCWVVARPSGSWAPNREISWAKALRRSRSDGRNDESKILIRRINSILQLSSATSYQDRDLNSSRIRSDLRSVAMERHMTMNG